MKCVALLHFSFFISQYSHERSHAHKKRSANENNVSLVSYFADGGGKGAENLNKMVRKVRGKAVLTAAKLAASSSKGQEKSKQKGGFASTIKTVSLLKKNLIDEEDEEDEEDDYDDLASEEAQDEAKADDDEEHDDHTVREVTLEDIRRYL